MTKDEAKKKLDRNTLLELRNKNRTFGNIDTNEKQLSGSEIVNLIFIEQETFKKINEIFMREDKFFANMRPK